jgi:hypothetical protein
VVWTLLSFVCFGLLLTLPTWSISKFFRVDPLMALALAPLLLVTLNVIIHNSLIRVNFQSFALISFNQSLKVTIILWFICGLYAVFPKLHHRFVETLSGLWLSVSLVSVTTISSIFAWLIGVGTDFSHPTDNDALSNAFLLRRFADTAEKSLCMVPGDVSRLVNIRFESCGAFILAHYSNLLGLVPLDKLLNSPYLLSAIFLPIGAAASWKYFSDKPNHRWIAAAASTTFLVYPYALNGLSRFTLGLAFALPLIGLCTSIERRDSRQLLLIAVSLVGLGYIHLLALATVLIYLAIVLVFSFVTIPLQKSTDTSSLMRAVSLCMRASVVMPAYFFFGSNFAIRSSVSNIQAATEIQIPTIMGTLGAPGIVASDHRNWPSATSILREIFLGSDWTRAQPLVFALFLFGMFLFLRRGTSYVPLVLSGVVTYGLYLSVAIWETHFEVYHFLFLNNWYRLYAVLVIFCVIPVTVSISHVITHYSKKSRGKLLLIACLMVYLLSLATGASIVNTAWNRDSKPTAQIMNQFDGLKKFSNLRTMNNPTDGSSWAYARSGIKLLSPNDRSDDMSYAENISYLVDKDSRKKACPVLIDQEVAAILAVDTSLDTFQKLELSGVIDQVVYHTDDVKLGLISLDFLAWCRSPSNP